MIWHNGRVVPREAIRVGADDRIFEHGLGLFETLRTWAGSAPLLSEHLARIRASAEDLGLPTHGIYFPDDQAVDRLVQAAGLGPDVMLRLTMTGGSASGESAVAWMTARPLPPPEPRPIRVSIDLAFGGSEETSIARHKNLNYWGRRLAYERACAMGLTEVLMTNSARRLWEGSRNNVLFVPAGEPTTIATPALRGPVIPGIMRRRALDLAESLGYTIDERAVVVDELFCAEAVFLTNSVRGVRRVDQVGSTRLDPCLQTDLSCALVDELPRLIRSVSGAGVASR